MISVAVVRLYLGNLFSLSANLKISRTVDCMLSFIDVSLLRALPFHDLEIIKDGDATSSPTNYLWNNSKANSNILTVKEIVWEKIHGINNFNYVTGLSNYKEIEK